MALEQRKAEKMWEKPLVWGTNFAKYRLSFWIPRLVTYWLLASISFVFLYPIMYMISTSMMTVADFIEPTIRWLPSVPTWDNFKTAWVGLAYPRSLGNSATIAILAALAQMISCAFVGYGFARIKFPGREILFAMVLFTFLIPPQTTIIPSFVLFRNLGWIDTYLPFIIPGLFAQGLRGSLFIFIFRQFFRGLPWEIEDAAKIDGAGSIRLFWSIMLPLARPALLVVFLFSTVWHWNDYFVPMIYLNSMRKFTLPLMLANLQRSVSASFGDAFAEVFNEPMRMAASFLVLAPPLLLYIFARRYFVESVDRTGLVE